MVAVCGCENTHLLLRVSHGAPLAAAALVPLGFVSFILLLCGNTIVTTLIIMRIWYLSPRRRNDVSGTNFPTGPGRAAIAITIESGMLNFVVQLITCVLYTMRHPGVGVVVGISVQTFVRICHLNGNSLLTRHRNHTGHRTNTYFHPNVRLVKRAPRAAIWFGS